MTASDGPYLIGDLCLFQDFWALWESKLDDWQAL